MYSGPTNNGTTAGYTRIIITTFDSLGTRSATFGYNDLEYQRRDYDRYRNAVFEAAHSETRRRLERVARSMRKILDDFKEAIRKAEIFAEVQKLAIATRRCLVAPMEPSQPGLALRPRARRHERQSVPSRTRRKLRTWER